MNVISGERRGGDHQTDNTERETDRRNKKAGGGRDAGGGGGQGRKGTGFKLVLR